MMRPRAFILLLAMCFGSGCVTIGSPTEPYPATANEVKAEIERMKSEPVALDRPVVVIDGWLPVGAGTIASKLRRMVGVESDDFLIVSDFPPNRFQDTAARVVDLVEKTWPSDDPQWTTEVDVVGYSWGGLVGRVAALMPEEGEPPRKQLRIKRLFTVSTPHRGTIGLVSMIAVDSASHDMQPGSLFLTKLDHTLPVSYEMICYTMLGDEIVGATHAAPPDREPIWVDGIILSHKGAYRNRRILADIALRLRGEEPLAGEGSRPPRN